MNADITQFTNDYIVVTHDEYQTPVNVAYEEYKCWVKGAFFGRTSHSSGFVQTIDEREIQIHQGQYLGWYQDYLTMDYNL